MTDRFEVNNELSKATDLGEIFGRLTEANLSLEAGDQDWFKFTLSASQGRLGEKIAVIFDQAKGDIDAQLYSYGGSKVISSSTGHFSNEEISLVGKSAGTYYLKIFGKNGSANSNYSLSVTNNSYRNNNTRESAAEVGQVYGWKTEYNLALDAGRSAWYKFNLDASGRAGNKAVVSWPSGGGNLGDLDLELYSGAGSKVSLVSASTGNTNAEEISLEGRPVGTYYLRVFGKNGAANTSYNLSFNGPPDQKTLIAPAGITDIELKNFAYPAAFSRNADGSWNLDFNNGTTQEALYRLEGYNRVVFSDRTVALDSDPVAATAFRIYKSAFNRTPDKAGLGYWISKMDSGMGIVEVASRFIDSAEFRSVYGSNSSDSTFLTRVYQNVLGREPESTGYNWWLNAMRTNPEKTRAKVLADFADSLENKSAVATQVSRGVEFSPYTTKEFVVTPRALTVNEGQTLSFDVATFNVSAGDELFYNVRLDQSRGITDSDIVGGNSYSLNGKFVAGTSGMSTFSIQVAEDNLTEGSETLAISVYASGLGSSSSSNTVTVTINDSPVKLVGSNNEQIDSGGGGGGGGGGGY